VLFHYGVQISTCLFPQGEVVIVKSFDSKQPVQVAIVKAGGLTTLLKI
jgi:hypothetical protein